MYVRKKRKPDLHLQQTGNKLLNMFFHRCSYKISCFSELAYNSSVLNLLISNLLNCLRSNGTIHNNRNWLKQPQSHITNQFLTKATIFCSFDVFSARPRQIFQVHTKISTMRPVFPDFLSVSYDYGTRNLNK